MTSMWCSKTDTEQEVPVITDVNSSYDFSEEWGKEDYNSHLFLSGEQLPKDLGTAISE